MKPVVLLALLAFVNSAAISNGRGVPVLDEETFTPFVTDNKHVLVQFCAHLFSDCKSFEPEYIKAAEKLKDLNSDIKLAKMDATEQTELLEKHKIRTFPTLKFFRDGKSYDYSGRLSAVDIVNWLLQKTGHATKAIASVAEAKAFVSVADVVVLGLFKDLESDATKEFLAAAHEINDIPFGLSSDAQVFDEYGVSGDSSILLFNEFDDSKVELEGHITSEAIVEFVKTKSIPLVIEYNRESATKLFGGEMKKNMYLLICVGKSHEKINQIKSSAKEGAKAFKDKVVFISVDTEVVEHQPMLDFFGMRENELPGMLLIHHSPVEDEITKYKHSSKDLTAKKIKMFVQAVLDGKLKPYLLSEEIPQDWDKNPVKTLVSKNFDQVAFDKTKDVLVQFYVPDWCEQCKQLVTMYEALAEKYKDDESIVIAKMNSMVNELEHTKITRFPTFKLYQKGDNKVITFKGKPTLEGFSEFILDNPSKKNTEL